MDISTYAESLIKSIASDPDMVKASMYHDEEKNEDVIEVMVKDEDLAMIIGKNGKNIKAIRILVHAYAYLNKLGKVKLNVESF